MIHTVLHIAQVVPGSPFLSVAVCQWIVLNPVYPAFTNCYATRDKEILSLLHLRARGCLAERHCRRVLSMTEIGKEWDAVCFSYHDSEWRRYIKRVVYIQIWEYLFSSIGGCAEYILVDLGRTEFTVAWVNAEKTNRYHPHWFFCVWLSLMKRKYFPNQIILNAGSNSCRRVLILSPLLRTLLHFFLRR
jgi:hypothetical protein